MSLETWAQAQIGQLLPLDEESMRQIVEYSSTLDPQSAADHLRDILGDSELATGFIDQYKQRRLDQEASQDSKAAAPDPPRHIKGKKAKATFNRLPEVRRPEDYGNTSGAYHKKDEDDAYMPGRSKGRGNPASGSDLSEEPEARQVPRSSVTANLLGASMPNVHTRTSSPSKTPRTSTPSPSSTPRSRSPRGASKHSGAAKASITGGTAMHGASTALTDLESALRSLEMSTNPTLAAPDPASRRCPCMGTRHPLLAAAPNCLSCGKVICAKEGLAPCTFCGTPLLSPEQVQDMVRALRDERGREKQAVNNASHQRAQVATTPRPFSTPTSDRSRDASPAAAAAALEKAQAHRDKLLGFQSTNAARTKVVDEAAAFETPDAGVSQWSSAVQRAAQLKRQQKVLREMEWNARPEYEKRKMVVSVDLVGGKVVRRMADVSRAEIMGPDDENEDENEIEDQAGPPNGGVTAGNGGAFSHNPLLGKLIRPVWRPDTDDEKARVKDKAATVAGREEGSSKPRTSIWRRVQDDLDDNEEVILNGGTFGGQDREQLRSEEPDCG